MLVWQKWLWYVGLDFDTKYVNKIMVLVSAKINALRFRVFIDTVRNKYRWNLVFLEILYFPEWAQVGLCKIAD